MILFQARILKHYTRLYRPNPLPRFNNGCTCRDYSTASSVLLNSPARARHRATNYSRVTHIYTRSDTVVPRIRTRVHSRHRCAISQPVDTCCKEANTSEYHLPHRSETRQRLQGLVSGITADSLEVSASEAFDILDEVDESMLRDVEDDLRKAGSEVVASTRHVSVLDQLHGGGLGIALRSLHFNDRLDLVQTCVKVCMKTGAIFHSHPPPSLGERSTHLQGLALGLVLQQASVLYPMGLKPSTDQNTIQELSPDAPDLVESETSESTTSPTSKSGTVQQADTPLNVSTRSIFPQIDMETASNVQHFKPPPCRVAVLGAGGCSLPAFLHELLPYVYLESVESHPDVIAMARKCFGVHELEAASARFRLHESTAEDWIDGEFVRQYSSRDVGDDISPFDLMAAYTKYTTAEARGDGATARTEGRTPLDLVIIDIENGDQADLIFGMQPAKEVEQSKSDPGDTKDDSSSQGYCLIAPPESILESTFMTKVCASVGPSGVVAINVLGTEDALLKVRERLDAHVPRGWTKSRCTAAEVTQTKHGSIKHCIVMLRNGPQVDRNVLDRVIRAMPNVVDDPTCWFDSWVAW